MQTLSYLDTSLQFALQWLIALRTPLSAKVLACAWILWPTYTLVQPSSHVVAYVMHLPACPCVLLHSKYQEDTYNPVVLLACTFQLHFGFKLHSLLVGLSDGLTAMCTNGWRCLRVKTCCPSGRHTPAVVEMYTQCLVVCI